MEGVEKIYHHHTPRQYLLPWADANECIAWLGYGKVVRSGLTVVGGERHFYNLKELTVQDIDCLKLFINGLNELGRFTHLRFLEGYIRPTQEKRALEESGVSNPDALRKLDLEIANHNENLHMDIENRFWPYLEALKNRDFRFYEDPLSAGEFFHCLYVQYLRTKAVRERVRQKGNVFFEDAGRVWDVLSHILAVETAASFLRTRKDFQILVLDNETQVPFITADQPIINIRSDAGDWNAPEKMELYYPLSPTTAMLYLEKATPIAGISRSVSIDEAHRYNMLMLAHSGFRVFSNSEEYLKHIQRSAASKN